MRFWFGRKSAAADVRPCVPAWLGGEGAADLRAIFTPSSRRCFGGIPSGSGRFSRGFAGGSSGGRRIVAGVDAAEQAWLGLAKRRSASW